MLVRWACEKLPTIRPSKRAVLSGDDPLAGVDKSDRELVGRWLKPASFPMIQPMFIGGFAQATRANMRPPQDALSLEAAIRALPETVRRLQAPAELGHGIGLPVDADAAWTRARAMIANLLLVHGRLGNRPVCDDGFVVSPVLAKNGQPAVLKLAAIAEAGAFGDVEDVREVRASRIGRDRYEDGAYCRLEYEPDPQSVVQDRAEYCAWRIGLDRLAAALDGKLEQFAVKPTAAPWAPWVSPSPGHAEIATAAARRLRRSDDAVASREPKGGRSRQRPFL